MAARLILMTTGPALSHRSMRPMRGAAALLATVALMATACAASPEPVERTPVDFETSIRAALDVLDLDRPGLEPVQQAAEAGDFDAAGEKLLEYYRDRDGVHHPVDRDRLPQRRGRAMSERDRVAADNALAHRFVGQPSYGPKDLGDPIDWSARPVEDNEWRWQLHRLRWWRSLGRAYWHTGDEAYAEAWAEQLLHWVAENPRHEQRDYAWRSLEAGHRAGSFAEHFQYFIDTPAMTPRVLAVFLVSLHEHGRHLTEHYSTGSNWALTEARGLLEAAVTFPEFRDAGDWRAEAVTRLNEEMRRQVHPDGHQRELSISYHVGAMRNFDEALEIVRLNDLADVFPGAFHERLERMAAVVMKLAMPDGRYAQFGSAWKRNRGHAWSVLANWLDDFPREDFEYLVSRGESGRPPQQTAFALDDSGLYSMRSGWDEDAVCVIFKNGPDGGFHSHPDNGTFEFYARGRHLMPDSGVYIYHGDDHWREWFRRSRVQQTITLDERDIAYEPRRRLWQPGDEHDVVIFENASYDDLTHRRAAFFINHETLVLIDDVIGDGRGTVRLHYHFAPGEAAFDHASRTARTDFDEGVNLAVHASSPDGLTLEEREGWVSYQYGEREPRPAFAFASDKSHLDRAMRFVTVITPWEDDPPRLSARVSDQPAAGSDAADVEIAVNDRRYRLRYDLDAGSAEVAPVRDEAVRD